MAPRKDITRKALRQWSAKKYGMVPRVPRTMAAETYAKWEDEYRQDNRAELERARRERQVAAKKHRYYTRSKAFQRELEDKQRAHSKFHEVNKRESSAATIQRAFRGYLEKKTRFAYTVTHEKKRKRTGMHVVLTTL